ncbi:hypothetical protein VC83_04056 [Pseudogymnoascus destructans]|uniref:Uncharacterized protein n=2 Tax=Pseudogymnoascus destructans TaxID=655981 RepID=L8G7D2_PSED2|nr:uncharacterized protein VC83_04056 [Pseudogymnoascus destructans]ELR08558.1 hypothetical protein GMDG_03253 [Pseudogymnoascus destructans 20631-21]OAF59703.1 hypothetical protein VC83_04056 [Pseudogymnoascus destructans]
MGTSVTETPGELMRQVATHLSSQFKDVTITIPRKTTWSHVLHETEAALVDKTEDDSIVLRKSRTEAQRKHFREIALQGAASWTDAEPTTSGVFAPGKFISTRYNTDSIALPVNVEDS